MACDKAALPSGGIQEGCSPLKNLMFKTLRDIILIILGSISVNFFYSQSVMSESEKNMYFLSLIAIHKLVSKFNR